MQSRHFKTSQKPYDSQYKLLDFLKVFKGPFDSDFDNWFFDRWGENWGYM